MPNTAVFFPDMPNDSWETSSLFVSTLPLQEAILGRAVRSIPEKL